MTTFQVDDMTCGHCASTITKALKAADATAQVQVDLATKRVEIASSADPAVLRSAIEGAGYTPVVASAVGQPAVKGGGCCGGH